MVEKLDSEIRKEQIARAALSLIGEQGLSRLSMTSLAKRVGIVPSAIYRHFKNKDEIIASTFDLLRAQMQANLELIQDEPDPVEKLHMLLLQHAKIIRENLNLPRFIFSEDVFCGDQWRRKTLHKIFEGYLGQISRIFEQGQKTGRIQNLSDPKTLTIMFIGLFQPSALLWHLSRGEFDATKQIERSWKIFSAAITEQSDVHSKSRREAK